MRALLRPFRCFFLCTRLSATPSSLPHVLPDPQRYYWPWMWPEGSSTGFLSSAEAAVGTAGRFGSLVGGTVRCKGRD